MQRHQAFCRVVVMSESEPVSLAQFSTSHVSAQVQGELRELDAAWPVRRGSEGRMQGVLQGKGCGTQERGHDGVKAGP